MAHFTHLFLYYYSFILFNLSWIHHRQPFYGLPASRTYRGLIYCSISSSSSRPHFSSHLLSHYTRSLDLPLPPESYKDLITHSYITFFESGVFNCDTLAFFSLAIYTTITATHDLLLTRPDSSDCVSIYSFLSSSLLHHRNGHTNSALPTNRNPRRDSRCRLWRINSEYRSQTEGAHSISTREGPKVGAARRHY